MNDTSGAYYLELDSKKPGIVGMATAASHADADDLRAVRSVAESFAAGGEAFTSEDVIGKLTDAQRERLSAFPNAMGGVFHQLSRQRIVQAQGYVTATKPEARGHAIRLWRGVRNGNR